MALRWRNFRARADEALPSSTPQRRHAGRQRLFVEQRFERASRAPDRASRRRRDAGGARARADGAVAVPRLRPARSAALARAILARLSRRLAHVPCRGHRVSLIRDCGDGRLGGRHLLLATITKSSSTTSRCRRRATGWPWRTSDLRRRLYELRGHAGPARGLRRRAERLRGRRAARDRGFGDVLVAYSPTCSSTRASRKRAPARDAARFAPLTIGLGPNLSPGATTDLAIEARWATSSARSSPTGPRRRSAAGGTASRATRAIGSYTPQQGVVAAARGSRGACTSAARLDDDQRRATAGPLDWVLAPARPRRRRGRCSARRCSRSTRATISRRCRSVRTTTRSPRACWRRSARAADQAVRERSAGAEDGSYRYNGVQLPRFRRRSSTRRQAAEVSDDHDVAAHAPRPAACAAARQAARLRAASPRPAARTSRAPRPTRTSVAAASCRCADFDQPARSGRLVGPANVVQPAQLRRLQSSRRCRRACRPGRLISSEQRSSATTRPSFVQGVRVSWSRHCRWHHPVVHVALRLAPSTSAFALRTRSACRRTTTSAPSRTPPQRRTA